MVELKCKRCGREWNYKGKKEYYCSCPDCRTSVKINDFNNRRDNKNDILSQPKGWSI